MTNLIGPGMPAQSLLGQVARQLWQGARRGHESTIRLAPLTAYRDYLDVRDAAAVILAAAANRATGVALTVGSGRALSVRFLVDLLIQVSGQPATIVERPDAGFDPRGPGWLRVDATTARDLLGWAPRHTVEDAVRELWNAGPDACDERVEPVG
jgi:dTDP-6-deoxy-L-talose 4-dehydrogenase [NAD(P)+]